MRGSQEAEVALGPSNLLLRGSTLRNTPAAVGLVIYAGFDTKVRDSLMLFLSV